MIIHGYMMPKTLDITHMKKYKQNQLTLLKKIEKLNNKVY